MDMAQFRNGYGSDSNPKLKGLADCRQRNVPASTQRPRSWLPRTRYDTNHQGWASEIPHQKDGWTIWTPKNDFKKIMGCLPPINWWFGFLWPIHSRTMTILDWMDWGMGLHTMIGMTMMKLLVNGWTRVYQPVVVICTYIYAYNITPGIAWIYYLLLTITVMGSQYGELKNQLKGQLDFLNEGGNLIFWLYTHVDCTELKAFANQ